MKSKGEKDDPRVPAGVTCWADAPQTTNELEDTEVQVWLGAGELKTPRGHVGGGGGHDHPGATETDLDSRLRFRAETEIGRY